MALNTNQLFGAIEPIKRKFYGLERNRKPRVMDKIFKVTRGGETVRHSQEYGGPSTMTLKQENQAMDEAIIRQGPNKTHLWGIYASRMTLSWELARDLKYRAIEAASRSMGRSMRLTPEYLAAQFLGRAFNSAYPVTADGVELCSTAHLLIGTNSNTLSNEMATPQAFGTTALEDIVTALMTQPGPDGLITGFEVESWLVPAALGLRAEKQSRTKNEPGTANNTVNVLSNTNYIIFPHLDQHSTTRYFALTDSPNGLFWEWDVEEEFMDDNSPTTLQKTNVAFFRARWGCDDPRHIYGVAATS